VRAGRRLEVHLRPCDLSLCAGAQAWRAFLQNTCRGGYLQYEHSPNTHRTPTQHTHTHNTHTHTHKHTNTHTHTPTHRHTQTERERDGGTFGGGKFERGDHSVRIHLLIKAEPHNSVSGSQLVVGPFGHTEHARRLETVREGLLQSLSKPTVNITTHGDCVLGGVGPGLRGSEENVCGIGGVQLPAALHFRHDAGRPPAQVFGVAHAAPHTR